MQEFVADPTHAMGESGMQESAPASESFKRLDEAGRQEVLRVLRSSTTVETEVNEVLNLLRAQQVEWTVPSMTNFGCEVLLLLQHCAKQLTMGTLRRLASIASEVFVQSLLRGASCTADTAGGLVAVCIAAAPPIESHRMDNFQIFLEVLQQKAPRLAMKGVTGSARSVAALLTQAVSALCAPPHCGTTSAADAAKTAARLCIVALLSPALKQREGVMRCFVEDMAVHLATASLEVGSTSEAAKLLLVSLMGSLSVVLRSRRASADGKVTCLKIVGRITQQLKGDDSEEMLCQSCRESQETCLACQAPETVEDPSGGTRSRDHSCRRNQTAREDASFEEGCDLCLVRWAANEMAEQSGKPRGPELELWPARFLLVESWREATPEADLLRDAGRLLQLTLWAQEKMPPGAAELLQQGHEWLAGTKNSLLRAARGWNGASAEAFQRPLRRLQRRSAQRLVRNLTSAVLAQLRSPQAHVRASALRALQSAPPQGFKLSRTALQDALSKDPSASVRAAAIPLVSSMGQDGKGHWDSWSLGLLRAAAAREDDSTAVRLGSCRVLAQALRGGELPKAAEICCEVAVHMNSLWSHTSAGGIMDDLQHFIFDDVESKGRGALLLEALASAHRLGAEQLLPVALKALKKSEANYQCKVQALAKALVDAFANAPAACGAALQALSAAAPWAMVEHLRAMSIYLAMGVPPTPDEEVRALSVCAALGNTLAEHKSPGKVLSPWAWARLHELCASQSSRLVRPAMRCLCLAAQAEENLSPILRHLRPALQLIRAQLEAAQAASPGNLLRAAWMAACACEFCDLNKMASPSDLGLLATTAMPSEKKGMLKRNRRDDRLVGTSIARDLLRIFQVFAGSAWHAPLPALVMAVGFALKRHWHLVGSEDFDQVISRGLGGLGAGQDLLAERSLEVLASLCDHLSRESEEGKDGCAAVLSKLTRHLPAVLRLARHGLHRRAEPGDVALRRMAVTAARALHRAGLGGNPAALGAVAMTSLFDRSLRHHAQLLLTALARKDPQALAQSQGQGLREAFAALLWQAPHQLAPSARSPALASAAAGAGKSFTFCGRVARGKWLRLVLGELTNSFSEGHFPALPAEPGAGASRRLGPFGASPVKDWTDSWPRVARLQLLYSHFLAQILCALPLSTVAPAPGQAEVEIVMQECRKFLELRCAAASSALEHEGSMSDSTLATCILSMVVKALLVALPWPEHLERLSALQAALCSESLRQVAMGDAQVAERCFQDAQGTDTAAKSPKKRRALAVRGGERPRKQRRAVRKAREGEIS